MTECQLAFSVKSLDELSDTRRSFTLGSDDFALLNPNTRTCPIFRSQMDAVLTKKIYSRVPVLIDDALSDQGNSWRIRFMRMFDMANDSHLFFDQPTTDRLPLYEAKLIHHYDHRWATYAADGASRDLSLSEKMDPSFKLTPRYWVEHSEVQARLQAQGWDRRWLMGWRDICRSSDERTVIASVLPLSGFGDTFLLMLPFVSERNLVACLLADQISLVHDFILRQKWEEPI